MKNLTIITHGAHGGRGGIDKYTRNLLNILSEKQNQFNINVLSKSKINLKKKNVNINYSIKFNYLFLILKNILNIYKSDLIIVTHLNLIIYLFFLIFNKKKILLFSYGLEIWGTKKNFIYRILIKKILYFICMRKITLDHQKKIYKIKSKKEFLLHNTLDKDIYIKQQIKRRNIILTVARLDGTEKYKGIDETLEAISLIDKVNFEYHIIGDGDDTSRLINKAKKLNISKYIKFRGYLSDVSRDNLFKTSRICLMPGTDKTFDKYPYRFSFLEAASHGLHIIATKPAKKELNIAKKYKNYNFVNSRDRFAISKKIIELLNKKNMYCNKLKNDFSFQKFKMNLIQNINIILKD